MFRVYLVSETAQVELKSGRVQAPATWTPRRRRQCSRSCWRRRQGLTLIHFSAQPETFLSLKPPNMPYNSNNECSIQAEDWASVSPLAAAAAVGDLYATSRGAQLAPAPVALASAAKVAAGVLSR